MLAYLLLFSFVNIAVAYEISCVSCKWFIPKNNDLGLCKMFKDTYFNSKKKENIIYNFAMHCKNDENLCGKSATFYQDKNDHDKNDHDESDYSIYEKNKLNDYNNYSDYDYYNEYDEYDEFDELKNRCCGEVNEKDELEQLDKELFDILQIIKKHNTKRIYAATKDLYKLFKRH